MLTELKAEFDISELMETLPYNPQEFEGLIKMSDFSWDKFGEGSGTGEPDEGEDEGKKEEAWEDFILKLPELVMLQFQQQLDRIKDIVTKQQGRKCKNMVQVIELLSVYLGNVTDEEIVKNCYE